MNTTEGSSTLRAWAKGIYPLEAGVELLIRCGFAGSGRPWVRSSEGRLWVDADKITASAIAAYSGGEQRMLRIAAALLGGEPISLYDQVPGLDREHLGLALAAIAHAGGTHESGGSLYPWPPPEV